MKADVERGGPVLRPTVLVVALCAALVPLGGCAHSNSSPGEAPHPLVLPPSTLALLLERRDTLALSAGQSLWLSEQLAVSGNTLILAWEQPRNGGGFELRVSVLGSGDTGWRTDAGPFHVLGPSHWGAVSLVTDAHGWSVLAWTNPASEGRYSLHTAWRNGSLP